MNDASFQPLHGALAPCVRGSYLLPQLFNDGQQFRILALGHLAVPSSLGVAQRWWPVVAQQLAVLGGCCHAGGRRVDASSGVEGGGGHVRGQVRLVRHPPGRRARRAQPGQAARAAAAARPGGGAAAPASPRPSERPPSARALFVVDGSGRTGKYGRPSP